MLCMKPDLPKQDKTDTDYENTGDSEDSLEQENRLLRETIFQLKNELDKFRSPALMLAELVEDRDETAVIQVPNGNKFLVKKSNDADDLMKPGDTVTVEQKNLTIVEKLDSDKNVDVDKFVIIDKPNVSWDDIGGLKDQERDLREVIELPLEKPDLFSDVGIKPPKGVLLHGPPGTGKTLMAKAVASSTDSTFIEIVGSELVQKFIGEGAKLVKNVFEMARQRSPSIVFIDELDAIAAKRVELGTSGEREVQRTFMQLLAELDGFDPLDDVKVIGCTNRKDILDPAITRPGRIDRKIEVGKPEKDEIKEIFDIHTKDMDVSEDVDIDRFCKKLEGFSGADIQNVCTEAGYFAIREDRTEINTKDLKEAKKKVEETNEKEKTDMTMFG